MSFFPRVWLDDAKYWPAGAAAAQDLLRTRGYVEVPDAADADVLVLAGIQAADVANSVMGAVNAGAGLVLLPGALGDRDVRDLIASAGVEVVDLVLIGSGCVPAESGAAPAGLHPRGAGPAQPPAEDLLARVDCDLLTGVSGLRLSGPAVPVLRLPGTSRDPGTPVAARSELGSARVVVLGVDIDEKSGDLLFNAITSVARRSVQPPAASTEALAQHPAWLKIKAAVVALRPLQISDGSIPPADTDSAGAASEPAQPTARQLVEQITESIGEIAPEFPHDADYLAAVCKDLQRWAATDFGVPDFLDSLQAFHPSRSRVDGRRHLVLFPMYTQNGNPDRNFEAVLIEVIWPEFVQDLEAGDYSNKLFVPIRFLDFTPGYDTNSAVLFPETIAMREVPSFSWGAIFADREAARFRSVVSAAAGITRLALPPDAARLLSDQQLAEQTFVMWDLIHDRTHMHGDLPFDPFMIKQRMPYFLYTLEELRCDLTAFRESVKLEKQGVPHARLVQYAILFDRIFRFAITGSRVRNYDGLGGQLLFAWLHQARVLNWTDNRLTIDWAAVTEPILELGRQIEHLYWQSIDRSKTAHWLAAYELVSATVAPSPLSTWAKGPEALPLGGPIKGLTDAVLADEFPLSMFYEALNRKLSPVVTATAGITG